MWQINLGAKVQIYNVEWKVLLQAKQQKQPLFYWDAWIGDFPDPFTFIQLFQTGNGQNSGDYHNVQYDALIDQASNTGDAAKRFQLFHQAESILNEDEPTIPVYFWENAHLVKPYREGLAIERNGSLPIPLHVYIGASGELNLIRYTIGRLAGAIPTLLIIITLSFLLLHAAPGGPFDAQKQIPPAIKANIERMYHLDEPLYEQYSRYLWQHLARRLWPFIPISRHDGKRNYSRRISD